ncbi:MAG: four helix bundle protein [Anaerolineae bacterium]|nr:four helix bundle protein [Anaerolineae bacterium]MCB0236863.1 four helix bundle protein [Anaerolineae bacterium]MCB0241767.1 four helix bundle protein [Anaerolineae bacterium]MCB0247384.1 four helix bundle protein [Anaerolineae bacterium]
MFRSYEEWLGQVLPSITGDPLWNFETYRKALFLSDLAWFDAEVLLNDKRGRAIVWQLLDSAGSVPANIEEGFGRGFGKDYGRFLKISLGSARETRGWYYRGRHAFDLSVVEHRLQLANEIISGLVTTSKQQYNR